MPRFTRPSDLPIGAHAQIVGPMDVTLVARYPDGGMVFRTPKGSTLIVPPHVVVLWDAEAKGS